MSIDIYIVSAQNINVHVQYAKAEWQDAQSCTYQSLRARICFCTCMQARVNLNVYLACVAQASTDTY